MYMKFISGHTSTKGVHDYLLRDGRALAQDFLNICEWPDKDETWDMTMDATRKDLCTDHGLENRETGEEIKPRRYEHIIISLDPEDDVTLEQFRFFVREYVSRWFDSDPLGRYQVAVVYHDDNEDRLAHGQEGILHAHIVINNPELETARRIAPKLSKKVIRDMRADLNCRAYEYGWHAFATNGKSMTPAQMADAGLSVSKSRKLEDLMNHMFEEGFELRDNDPEGCGAALVAPYGNVPEDPTIGDKEDIAQDFADPEKGSAEGPVKGSDDPDETPKDNAARHAEGTRKGRGKGKAVRPMTGREMKRKWYRNGEYVPAETLEEAERRFRACFPDGLTLVRSRADGELAVLDERREPKAVKDFRKAFPEGLTVRFRTGEQIFIAPNGTIGNTPAKPFTMRSSAPTMAERQVRKRGEESWKDDLRCRIDLAVRLSVGSDLDSQMDAVGVVEEVKKNGEIKYAHASAPHSRTCLAGTLGPEYKLDYIRQRVAGRHADVRQRAGSLGERVMGINERRAVRAMLLGNGDPKNATPADVRAALAFVRYNDEHGITGYEDYDDTSKGLLMKTRAMSYGAFDEGEHDFCVRSTDPDAALRRMVALRDEAGMGGPTICQFLASEQARNDARGEGEQTADRAQSIQRE